MKHKAFNVLRLVAILILTSASVGHPEKENNSSLVKPEFSIIDQSLHIEFPQDHGAHHPFRFEWWYLTANLKDKIGTDHGVQFTIFRTSLEPKMKRVKGWNNAEIWMAHVASTDKNTHIVEEKFARGGISQAGVFSSPFRAWIDNWELSGQDFSKMEVSVQGKKLKYYLRLEAEGPIILHGENGLSLKSESGQASAYYSQPFFKASGWIEKNGAQFEVTGSAWFDHEWSSQFLDESKAGWDWFSLNLSTGERIMLFKIRDHNGSQYYSGTLAKNDGSVENLDPNGITLQPIGAGTNEIKYPTEWKVKISDLNVDVIVKALNSNSFMDTRIPYWEGPIKLSGSHEGMGYLEMTGYESESLLPN